MTITNLDIVGQLERLAQACPWDTVDLWISREPEGKTNFTAHVKENATFGFPYIFGHDQTPEEAVTRAVKQTGNRDPEISRKQAIAELQSKIEKLQAVVIGLPPYRPGRILSNGEKVLQAQPTINV